MGKAKHSGAKGWVIIAILAVILVVCAYYELFMEMEVITQTPPSERYFANPMMGFAPWSSDPSIDETDTLVYMDATWAELEPTDDVFAFEDFEANNHCDRWRAEGKQMVFRLSCDYPRDEAHIDIPQWLYDKTNGDGCHYDVSYGKGYSPNYANPLFISEHEELIQALGERYRNNEFVYYIELGSIGHWGEWHVNTGQGVDPLPPLGTLALYGRQYADNFPSYRLMTRRPFAFAVDAEFGLYNDMTGDVEATEEFLEWTQIGGEYNGDPAGLAAYPDGWMYTPVGGEVYSHITEEDYLGENTDRTIALLRASHTTFIGPGCPNDETGTHAEDAERIRAAIGYRYRIASCRRKIYGAIGRRQTMEITLTNDGVAPMYEVWEFMLYYRDDEGNVVYRQHTEHFTNELMPGETLTLNVATDFENSDGATRLDLVVEDPRTVKPSIRWAMDTNVDGDGYYGILIDKLVW